MTNRRLLANGAQGAHYAPMQNVLTLIVNPDGPGLDDTIVDAARAALADSGAAANRGEALAPGLAWDIAFSRISPERGAAAVRDALGDAAVDVVAQPVEGRRKKLLVADMESTIIENEMLDELADFIGIRERIAEITQGAMNGELDFDAALSERVGLLKGLPVEALDRAAERITVTPGARALVRTMRTHGAYTALVSGGFRFFTRRIRENLGFDFDQANELEIRDGKLTGAVKQPTLSREAKLEALRRLAGERRLPLSATLAVGDGANDLPMLLAAGLGVAYHAKPSVAPAARARIEHGDLTALLFAQGYRAGEIKAGEIKAGEIKD